MDIDPLFQSVKGASLVNLCVSQLSVLILKGALDFVKDLSMQTIHLVKFSVKHIEIKET